MRRIISSLTSTSTSKLITLLIIVTIFAGSAVSRPLDSPLGLWLIFNTTQWQAAYDFELFALMK